MNGRIEAFWAILQAEVLERQHLADLAAANAAVDTYATYYNLGEPRVLERVASNHSAGVSHPQRAMEPVVGGTFLGGMRRQPDMDAAGAAGRSYGGAGPAARSTPVRPARPVAMVRPGSSS